MSAIVKAPETLPAVQFLSEGERYAREQQPDNDYDADLQDGFALKYGTAHGAD